MYAKINETDCKNVNKDEFLNNSTRKEYRYAVKVDIGPEDNINRLQGKEYRFYIESFRIDTTNSSFILKLNIFRTFLPFYFLILLVWSPIFFQLLKIYEYLFDTNTNLLPGLLKKLYHFFKTIWQQ